MMMNIRTLFKELDRDHYKPTRTDSGFAERNDNYIEYTSNADRYENLSPKEYPNVIRQYLRDLIDENKTIMELNNNNNNNDNNDNNDNNNNNNNSNNNSNNRAKWKIQLIIKNNFISVNDFEDTRIIYSASKPVETFMGSNAENVIDTIFDTILNRIQQAMETSNERGSGFTHDSVG